MAVLAEMTQLSPTMKEGVLVEWHKHEGDAVHPGDILASVETDKAVIDLEAFDDGVLLKILAAPGSRHAVGSPIAVIGATGEDISSLLSGIAAKSPNASAPAAATPPQSEKSAAQTAVPNPIAPVSHAPGDHRIKASPLARNLAGRMGISLEGIAGSGPGGRIIKRDVEKAGHSLSSSGEGRAADRSVPASMMRKAIATRLTDSKLHIPHFYLHRKIRMKALEALRKTINEDGAYLEKKGHHTHPPVRVSVNDFLVRACALALQEHPGVNASWRGETILQRGNIDIGIAVAIEEGLMTPVIRNADRLSLHEIAVRTRKLALRARERKLQPAEYTDGSFTISNLGMFGIDFFEAIINEPEAALLAAGRIVTEPEWDESAQTFHPQLFMTLTLSCDHRVVDGAAGAQFLDTLADLLEHPSGL